MGNGGFEARRQLKYLGVLIMSNNDSDKEPCARIAAGNKSLLCTERTFQIKHVMRCILRLKFKSL